MNIKNLETTTYKNYKVICEVLGVEPKKGDSKKAQLKVFKQYFNWENQGQKWIVTEIYEQPQEKQDGRKYNGQNESSKQALRDNNANPKMFDDNQIEKMVLLQFLRHFYSDKAYPVDEEFSYTMERINYFCSIGLCNHNYKEITGSRYTLTTRDIDWIDDYYCHSKTFDLALGNSYQSMQSKVLGSCYIIEPVVTVCLCFNDEYDEYDEYDEDCDYFGNDEDYEYYARKGRKGKLRYKRRNKSEKRYEYHTSSVGEYQLIEDCKKQAIQNFNEKHNFKLNGSTDIHYKLSKKQKEELYDDMTELIRANGIPYFSHCVSSFKITAKKEYVKERLMELGVTSIDTLDGVQNEIKLLRDEINQLFVTRQHERLDNAHDKAELMEVTRRQEKKLFGKRPRSDKYVLLEEEQMNKAHILVDCSHKNLSREEHREAQKLLLLCNN